MKNLLIVIASNRAQPNDRLFKSLASFAARGTAIIHHTGTTDVALARNVSLTLAHTVLLQNQHDMVLMLDDDMVFNDNHVIEVLDYAYHSKRPTSACYVLSSGALAARRRNGKWMTGLGFLAIPSKVLLDLAEQSLRFTCPLEGAVKSTDIIQFTETRLAPVGDKLEWQGEDFVFCERLGGVNLVPVSVGHLKQQVLQAASEPLKQFLEEQERA